MKPLELIITAIVASAVSGIIISNATSNCEKIKENSEKLNIGNRIEVVETQYLGGKRQ